MDRDGSWTGAGLRAHDPIPLPHPPRRVGVPVLHGCGSVYLSAARAAETAPAQCANECCATSVRYEFLRPLCRTSIFAAVHQNVGIVWSMRAARQTGSAPSRGTSPAVRRRVERIEDRGARPCAEAEAAPPFRSRQRSRTGAFSGCILSWLSSQNPSLERVLGCRIRLPARCWNGLGQAIKVKQRERNPLRPRPGSLRRTSRHQDRLPRRVPRRAGRSVGSS